MDFIANAKKQIDEMLAELGITSIAELFAAIPSNLLLPAPTHDDGLSEYEGLQLMERLAAKNHVLEYASYLGAGAYEHHVPALVGSITGKAEFLTAYTPYQAEASQGLLQAIFEFQSVISALTGLEVANASLYDGASACGEALLMALRQQKGRSSICIAESLHPQYRGVAEQYLKGSEASLETISFDSDGQLDLKIAAQKITENTAAILIASPNFFGQLEDVKKIVALAHQKGALVILAANPLSFALFASPGELGVDIAVGDVQPLGLTLQYGGPYAGYLSTRLDLVRQMPGRLVGETVDLDGKRAFVLTLQAREQHIRREKATSNICTNQALAALAVLVAALWYGPKGLHELALTNYQRAAYLKEQLKAISGVKLFGDSPSFNEFVVRFPGTKQEIENHFMKHKILPGVELGPWFPKLANHWLVAVTEIKSQAQLDAYVSVAKALKVEK